MNLMCSGFVVLHPISFALVQTPCLQIAMAYLHRSLEACLPVPPLKLLAFQILNRGSISLSLKSLWACSFLKSVAYLNLNVIKLKGSSLSLTISIWEFHRHPLITYYQKSKLYFPIFTLKYLFFMFKLIMNL